MVRTCTCNVQVELWLKTLFRPQSLSLFSGRPRRTLTILKYKSLHDLLMYDFRLNFTQMLAGNAIIFIELLLKNLPNSAMLIFSQVENAIKLNTSLINLPEGQLCPWYRDYMSENMTNDMLNSC